MTAVAEKFAVRVMVTDAWDQVTLAVDAATGIAELKRRALEQALQRRVVADDYIVKFRGAQVLDETVSLGSLLDFQLGAAAQNIGHQASMSWVQVLHDDQRGREVVGEAG